MTPEGRPWSIRRRLLVTLLVLLLVGLVGGPLIASLVVRDYLGDRTDERLGNVSSTVGGIMSGRDEVVIPAARLSDLPNLAAFVVIGLDADGDVVITSGPDDPPPDLVDEAVATGGDLDPGEVTDLEHDDRSYRLAHVETSGLAFATTEGEVPVEALVVVEDTTDDVTQVRRIERAGVVYALVAMAVLGTVGALVLRRGLRPLELMADAADEVTAGGSGERFAELRLVEGAETARLATALDQAFEARRRAVEAQRTFVADASHELRTPLTTLSGWLDLYAQGGLDDPDERDRAMARMESEVGRMRLLVDELALLARADQGRPLARDDVALVPLLAGVLEDAEVVAPGRRFTLDDGAGDPVVPADRARLEQVFRNLVGNASQHTPEGTPVEVRLSREGADVVVDVVDHGPGIAPDDLERVFDRFYRTEPSRARHQGGSGLGLAIARALVEEHGGRVGATSSSAGTTMRVHLPGS